MKGCISSLKDKEKSRLDLDLARNGLELTRVQILGLNLESEILSFQEREKENIYFNTYSREWVLQSIHLTKILSSKFL